MNLKTYRFAKLFLSFKEYELEQGKLVIDELAEGAEATLIDNNGEEISADGVFETEDGKITIEEGKVVSIEVEEVIEEPIEEEVIEEPIEEPEPEQEPEPETNPELEEANRIIEEQTAKIAELEARIAELEEELNKPIDEPIEMKAVAKVPSPAKSGALKYFE